MKNIVWVNRNVVLYGSSPALSHIVRHCWPAVSGALQSWQQQYGSAISDGRVCPTRDDVIDNDDNDDDDDEGDGGSKSTGNQLRGASDVYLLADSSVHCSMCSRRIFICAVIN